MTEAGTRLLDAASDLFYRRGVRAVGVDLIAETAGTTKKTLYDRFGSKDALVALYLLRRAHRWRGHLLAPLARAGGAPPAPGEPPGGGGSPCWPGSPRRGSPTPTWMTPAGGTTAAVVNAWCCWSSTPWRPGWERSYGAARSSTPTPSSATAGIRPYPSSAPRRRGCARS